VVRLFLDLTMKALQTVDYERAVIVWCSDEVPDNGVQVFTKKEAMEWHYDGQIRAAGGGTHLEPAFRVIADQFPDVRCITYLTDGGVGTDDVVQAGKIVRHELGNVPVLWLLIDDTGYEYVRRFVDWVKEYKVGRCAFLPMDKLDY